MQVAELPLLAAFWSRRGLFHDLAHRVLSLVSQSPERAVARPVGGYLGPRYPPAINVPVQVVLRADAGIQLVDGDTGWERHALQRRTSGGQNAEPHGSRRSPAVHTRNVLDRSSAGYCGRCTLRDAGPRR